MTATRVHLVGSIGLDSVDEVFRTVTQAAVKEART